MREILNALKENKRDIIITLALAVVFVILVSQATLSDINYNAEPTEAIIVTNTTEQVAETEPNFQCPTNVTTVTVHYMIEVQPQAKTGEVSFGNVGMSAIMDDFIESDMTLCTWGGMAFTQEEINLLRTTVFCEAGNQDIDTQIMVALTILNRLKAGYGNSIREVIYQDGAYAVTKWSNFENRGWTEQVERAVDIALRVNEYPNDMYYFRTDFYHNFADNYIKSGDLYFSTQGGE